MLTQLDEDGAVVFQNAESTLGTSFVASFEI